MNKTILKNFAIEARNKLIQDIKNKAAMLGITEEGIANPLSESTTDMLMFNIGAADPYIINDEEVKQYHKLKSELEKRTENDEYTTAYTTLIEEVAYTWFNRLIAIRFMEVNNYMPDKMRVLSSGREGVNEPEFVTNYRDTSLDFTHRELDLLSDWKMDASAQSMERVFHLLFIKQCNALNENLPELFEKTDDYAELLLTISYNDPDGVLYKLVHDIPEDYFDVEGEDGNGQVEIIGWMYQYYNTEKNNEVINIYKGIVKKEDIPAATQLFTPDWVVRYMVDNSLGKYWLERNPDSNIKDSLEYLMPGEIEVVDEKISLEDLKIFDNAMGSGHCLSYAFDVLMMIYESEGYTGREAAKLIVEKNLYGLDIDKRAYQLAYFAIMMKARRYNRRALNGNINNNLAVFEDSVDINKNHLDYLGRSMDKKNRELALQEINYLIEEFGNAREIGSILILDKIDQNLLLEFINDGPAKGQVLMGQVNIEETRNQLEGLVQVAAMLTQKYDTVVTNPPYLNKFSPELKKYINKNYKDYKSDLFSVFIYNNLELCKPNGYSAYMSPFVWMFIKTYEKLREYIIQNKHISSIIQMEYSAFDQATVPICTFVLQNFKSEEKGKYVKLSDFKGGMEVQRIKTLEAIANPDCGYYYEVNEDNFEKISGKPIAYWLSKQAFLGFNSKKLELIASTRVGLVTGNTERFLRNWSEVNIRNIYFKCLSNKDSIQSSSKWFPYQKGGPYRKWYGNNEFVVNWENDGFEMKNDNYSGKRVKSHNYNGDYAFKEALTWTKISSGSFASRFVESGYLFDDAGSICSVDKENIFTTLGLLNSKIGTFYINILSPTMNYLPGNIDALPYKKKEIYNNKEIINNLININIDISKSDWDYFETSWDFTVHSLLDKNKSLFKTQDANNGFTIEQSYNNWKQFTNNNFTQLKQNEEELNRIFIEIYGLQDELTPEVSDKDITITKIFDHKDEIYDDIKGNRYILTKEDVIKSFISYAVGCMFGRYSLDEEGLAYAGGEWDMGKYKSFIPTKDNIILITDEDYFQDDIVNRFIEFVKVTYGEETLDENLQFIADALGGKAEPKEVIRNYFLKNFYKDHVQTYKKRPIYWLYDSGKADGFKALIYMHRYDRDTTGKLRIDYLHKLQKAYERRVENLKYDIANNKNPREVAAAEKELTKLTKQIKETKDYDEKIGHLAVERIAIDLDDGVKVNYDKVQTDERGKNLKVLAKI